LGVGRGRLNPINAYPLFSSRAKGTYIWDVDNNRFIDYGCAYGTNSLGYNDPDIEMAVSEQRKKSDCTTVVSPIIIDAAEIMVDTVASADWAFFAKNGGDVTTLAIMVARAATGRKKTVMMSGCYHGVAPWCQKKGNPGILDDEVKNNIFVDFNNFEMLEKAVSEHPGEIASVISMPYHHTTFVDNIIPEVDYWKKVRRLCTDKGIVLIFDDVRAGFRMDFYGSDHYFGIKADLITLGKAVANGHNISVLCGSNSLRDAVESVTYTGSYWMSAVPLAALVATVKKMKSINAVTYMQNIGKSLTDGLVEVAKNNGFELKVSGLPSLFFLRVVDPAYASFWHQDWIAEMVRRGVYITHYHNMFTNCSITVQDLDYTFDAADEAFKVVKEKYRL
jgi:glutamate-1-semialdehyde 2,1-aminomutase